MAKYDIPRSCQAAERACWVAAGAEAGSPTEEYTFLFLFFSLFRLIFNWSIIALQYCIGLCQIATWISHQLSSVQSLGHVRLFVIPWTTAPQVSLSITNCQSLHKLMSIESVMPSKHLILCHPLLLLPSIFPRIRVFSKESAFHIRWPKYWRFNFNISPPNEHPGLISFRMDGLDLL